MHFGQREVEAAFNIMVKALPPHLRDNMELNCFAPGGRNMYRIMREGATPFGSNFWVGSREAYEGIWTIIKTIQLLKEGADLLVAAPEMVEALKAVIATYRTFRNVPIGEQEWTPLDDESLEAAETVLAKVLGQGVPSLLA